MNSIDNLSEKWKEKGIKLSPFFMEEVDKKVLKICKGNNLEVESYLEQDKNAFEQSLNLPKYESVAALLYHKDNFNNTMNGKDTFNMEYIKKAIENDFKSAYSIIKNRKETQLL